MENCICNPHLSRILTIQRPRLLVWIINRCCFSNWLRKTWGFGYCPHSVEVCSTKDFLLWINYWVLHLFNGYRTEWFLNQFLQCESSFSYSFFFIIGRLLLTLWESWEWFLCKLFLIRLLLGVYWDMAVCPSVLDKSGIIDSSSGMLEMFFPWFEVMSIGFCIENFH